MRGSREQVERLHFAHAVAVTFPFLERGGNLVGAAEHVGHADRLAHGERMNHARFAALARRVEQDFLGFVRDGAREPGLDKVLVDLACDKAVVFLEVLGRCLRAFDGKPFPFHAEHGLGRFAERKAEQAVTAVQIQEVVFLGEREHAACSLDEVVDLAFVNLAESRDRVLEAEFPEVEAQFARAVELLEVESVCRALRFQVVCGFGGVHVGVRRRHVEGGILQRVRNQLELAHDARVNLLDVENDDAVLVSAADDNPVERVGERLVRRRNQFLKKEIVNLVVLFGFEHRFLAVELEVARLHEHAALARGAVASGERACDYLLRVAREAVHVPKFLDGEVLDVELVLVVEHGERFAVGGIGFACVVRNLVCDGLFEEHVNLFLQGQI